MIVFKQDTKGRHYCEIKARNGKILWMTTKAFLSLPTALDAMQNLITAVRFGQQMEVKKSKNEQWYGVIAVDGVTWKTSETYRTRIGVEKSFGSLKRYFEQNKK